MEQVPRGWFKGHFAESPFSCETLAQTGASITGTTRWAYGYDFGKRAKFENSPIQNDDVVQGSFVGTARVALSFPPSLASLCTSGREVSSASVTGTLTLGPSCGPGSGALTIFQIVPGPICGGIYAPTSITAGPDGALWFTNENSIGRITTSGTVTRYFDPSITNPWSITAGPDGALWFTNYAGSPAIGRITTSGVVTAQYADPGIVIPFDITSGPDADIWFTNYGSDTVGRITPP